jgi:two-component system sensor histidine kinase PrrB
VRSLRGRLTLGVLAVLALVLLAAGAVAVGELDRSDRAALDDRLQRTAELTRATSLSALQDELPEQDGRLDAVLTATGSSLRLRLGTRVVLDTGAPPPQRGPLRRGFSTFTSATGGRFRAYVTTLDDPALGALARQEVVSSLRGLEDRQARLRRRLALIAAVGLLLTGAGVWLAADLVLRPLRRLRRLTSSVAADEDLDQRVPDDDGPGELRSLAASFNAMLARLGRSAAARERALEATRRFAADAGHELRTPLTSVQATLSTLRRHPELPPERRTAMAAEALEEQAQMVALLDGLQALARGDAAPLEHTAVDLADLVDAAAVATVARFPALTVDTDLPDGPVVLQGWEPGLRLLVDNIVGNAARHGRADGQVAITLTVGPAPTVVLTVDDDGPGVPPEEREAVFAPFHRLQAQRPGSGLGLALVAQQARHHGAVVALDESPLGGTRVTVRFTGR